MLGCPGCSGGGGGTISPVDAGDGQGGGEVAAKDVATEVADGPAAPTLCDPDGPLVLTNTRVDLWWWEGEDAPTGTVSVVDPLAGCSYAISVSDSWLDVDLVGGQLRLQVEVDDVETGRHQADVTLIPQNMAYAATVIVDVRVMHAPPANAVPKALVVGIDGVRADALEKADTPTIDMLVRHGAWSFAAHTQLQAPTKSGPGWASVLSGVDAAKHGVQSNDATDMAEIDPAYPSFLTRIRDQLGLTTAAVVNWVPIMMMVPETSADTLEIGDDAMVGEKMSALLRDGNHGVHFVHLDEVDGQGHTAGFSADNPAYLDEITECDTYLGDMVDAVLDRPAVSVEDWLFVVTTDHGGYGTGHGPMDADNQTIWLVVAGAGVAPAPLPGGTASHMDVHPTTLAHMGLWPDEAWDLDGLVQGVVPP